jgi:hypothetical protein
LNAVDKNSRKSAEKRKEIRSLRVEDELEFGVVLSQDLTVPIRVEAAYRARDPYAVHLTFHFGIRPPVHWAFARNLLTTGMLRPSGMGDVRVWPAGNGALIRLSFASPQGNALMEVRATALTWWLNRTHRLVPPGTEGRHLHLDSQLKRLLHDGR